MSAMRLPVDGFFNFELGKQERRKNRLDLRMKTKGSSEDSPKTNLRKSAQSVDDSSTLPNSKKVYVSGKIHSDVRVAFREISLAPTKSMNGEIEINAPVRVYDTSGPWGDPSVTLDPVQGLPPLRRNWILARGDVEEIEGRVVRPIDDGFLSEKHAEIANRKRPTLNVQRPTSNGNGHDGNSSFVIRHSS